jgi:urease accessory protein
MIARTRAVVAAGGKLAELSCQPPLTLRQVAPQETGVCALCLVGSAAGPLAGDDLALTLEVLAGASATLQAAGAAIAQGRPGRAPGRLHLRAVVAEGAALRADPGSLIVRAGGRVETCVEIHLAVGATVEWRELIVLGAAGEPGAQAGYPAATLRWEVTRGGRPLLRQLVDLTDPAWQRWPGMIAGRRVLASVLLAGPAIRAATIVAAPTALAQRLTDDATQVTVLADDAADAQRQAGELCARVRR